MIVALVIRGKRPSRLDDPALSDGAWEIIQKCWDREPRKRQGMKDVMDSLVAMSPAKARNHEMLIKEPMPAPPLTSSNTGRGEDVEKGGAGVDGKKRTVKDEDSSILEEAKLTSISGESVLCAVVLLTSYFVFQARARSKRCQRLRLPECQLR